ncbi:class I SAM-dependent methyltransferase [Micropruina sonneratiae]|uniref:class I SAM-dependent methyltransferase n=1 Tax=Micropruina sonneratiae TaxID=2986940 RepID=UPI002225DFE7|nr:class I SAM-dependent methyltransferase [Micropruina sp. KQZ13P-5]MCW3158929.1 class I SAM-dependent methyltransferase [Micropruina sp. KQZ13P-5]
MYPPSQWAQIIARDPGHSQRYIDRFAMLAAQGNDLVGEARLIDAMVGRNSAVLDAGCGPGRHCGYLHRAGHRVVGVDLDPALIAEAERAEPGPHYLAADLTGFELPEAWPQSFDAILCAGNVMGFVHPETRRPILAGFAARLAPQGRAVVGFGAGRGYDFGDFVTDAAASGLELQQAFSTWDLRRFTEDSNFLVAVLGLPG